MSKPVINSPKKKSKRSSDAGVSVTELLVVIVVIGVVSSFAIASFLTAGKSAKLSGATRTLSTYLEKAHVDSVRRHGGASVNLNSATSYTVNIAFGTGSATARTITLTPRAGGKQGLDHRHRLNYRRGIQHRVRRCGRRSFNRYHGVRTR